MLDKSHLLSNADEAFSERFQILLSEYNAGNNILVHCFAGMQRSAAVVHMFLMTLWRQKKEPVYAYMRERRPIVFQPAMNFQRSVEWYEEWLFINILKT